MNTHKVSDWLEVQDNGPLVILQLKSKRVGEPKAGMLPEFVYGMDRAEALMLSIVLSRDILGQTDGIESAKS